MISTVQDKDEESLQPKSQQPIPPSALYTLRDSHL